MRDDRVEGNGKGIDIRYFTDARVPGNKSTWINTIWKCIDLFASVLEWLPEDDQA